MKLPTSEELRLAEAAWGRTQKSQGEDYQRLLARETVLQTQADNLARAQYSGLRGMILAAQAHGLIIGLHVGDQRRQELAAAIFDKTDAGMTAIRELCTRAIANANTEATGGGATAA